MNNTVINVIEKDYITQCETKIISNNNIIPHENEIKNCKSNLFKSFLRRIVDNMDSTVEKSISNGKKPFLKKALDVLNLEDTSMRNIIFNEKRTSRAMYRFLYEYYLEISHQNERIQKGSKMDFLKAVETFWNLKDFKFQYSRFKNVYNMAERYKNKNINGNDESNDEESEISKFCKALVKINDTITFSEFMIIDIRNMGFFKTNFQDLTNFVQQKNNGPTLYQFNEGMNKFIKYYQICTNNSDDNIVNAIIFYSYKFGLVSFVDDEKKIKHFSNGIYLRNSSAITKYVVFIGTLPIYDNINLNEVLKVWFLLNIICPKLRIYEPFNDYYQLFLELGGSLYLVKNNFSKCNRISGIVEIINKQLSENI
uniref:CRAL-TRIO domain-containing protein n=1 Tax=Strongyloides venezuelensis TaxID=75913 RepID=A0A0K0FRN8_STRVS